MAELEITLLHHRFGIGEEASVAGDVGRVEGRDLAVQRLLVVDIVERRPVFPQQPVEGRDGQELHIVRHAPA